jgi:hypothetical protein
MLDLASPFARPLSEEAWAEFLTFQGMLQSVVLQTEDDSWSFLCSAGKFRVSKAYKLLMGDSIIHQAFLLARSSQQAIDFLQIKTFILIYGCVLLPLFRNIRYFSFVKVMYLDIF